MANSVTHLLPYPIANARFSLPLSFRVAAGMPTDPTTPDTEFSTDGGATFTDCAEEITTGGANGMGFLTLTGAETNTRMLLIAAKSANCVTTPAILHPRTLAIVGSGTLSTGSSGGGTLGTLLAYDVTGCFIRTTGGTAGGGTGGANNQARRILTYNTTTGAFTVSTWETTPDATTTYDVLLPEGITLGMLKTLNSITPARTTVFEPTQIPDLQFWFEPAKGSLFQDTGTATPATADTDPVGHPPDWSGNGYDATQGTANQRPLLKTTAFNGLACIRFDGSNDNLSLGNPTALAGASRGSYTSVHCIQITSLTNTCQTLLNRGSGDVDLWDWIGTLGTGVAGFAQALRAKSHCTQAPLVTATRYVLTHRCTLTYSTVSGTSYMSVVHEHFVNGQLIGYHVIPVPTAGGNWSIGSRNDANFFFAGDLAVMLFVSRAVSETEREQLESYCATKYNVSLSRTPPPSRVERLNVILDGNSIPASGGSGAYRGFYHQARNRILFAHSVQITASDGSTTTNNTANVPTLVMAVLDPSKLNVVVFHEITNEISAGTSAATCFANLLAYCAALRALNPVPLIIVMTPIARNWGANQTAYEANRQAIMDAMIADANTHWDYLLDIGNSGTISVYGTSVDVSSLGGPANYSSSSFQADQVHPSYLGHAIIATALQAAVNGLVGARLGVPANYAATIDSNGRMDLGKILGTASAGVAGYVGPDWSHVNAPTTTVALTGTTIGTLTTYTGNTPQTGDSFARIGATGSGLTSLAPSATALSTAVWTGTLAIHIDTIYSKLPANSIADETLVINATNAILSVVNSIQVDTNDIQANLPNGLTDDGFMKSDIASIQTSLTHAGYLHDIVGQTRGVGIVDGGITEGTIATPTETSGRPTTILGMIRRLFEWASNKRTRDRNTGIVLLRNSTDNGTLETQTQSTIGTTDSQTKGV